MVPPEVSDVLSEFGDGAMYVAGAVLAALIAIRALKAITMSLSIGAARDYFGGR